MYLYVNSAWTDSSCSKPDQLHTWLSQTLFRALKVIKTYKNKQQTHLLLIINYALENIFIAFYLYSTEMPKAFNPRTLYSDYQCFSKVQVKHTFLGINLMKGGRCVSLVAFSLLLLIVSSPHRLCLLFYPLQLPLDLWLACISCYYRMNCIYRAIF